MEKEASTSPSVSSAPLPLRISDMPAELNNIYDQVGAISQRLGTADEKPDDFETIRSLLHRYCAALTPYCIPLEKRRVDNPCPPASATGEASLFR